MRPPKPARKPAGTLALTAALIAATLAALAFAQAAPADQPADPAAVPELIAQLGADDYATREDATRALLTLGRPVTQQLTAARDAATDPEIRRRLDYVLAGITPPDAALLVIRINPDTGLAPGDLITHLDGRPVADSADLQRLRRAADDAGIAFRGLTPTGPREGILSPSDLVSWSSYREPYGPQVSEIIRDFASGRAEEAYAALEPLDDQLGTDELDYRLRAVINYVAGRRAAAIAWLRSEPAVVFPAYRGNLWTAPSQLDLDSPVPAPHELELALWEDLDQYDPRPEDDPDLRVQRIFVPARRYPTALLRGAGFWWQDYRDDYRKPEAVPQRPRQLTNPGNMLAVISWMCSELDLVSESLRLIEPRSIFLRAGSETNLWVRVRTDAWLPFLKGETEAAIDRFYPDARDILTNRGSAWRELSLVRQADIAARIAFFLYQAPGDERRDALLAQFDDPAQPAVAEYARWMCFSLTPANEEVIRKDLAALLPASDDAQAARVGAWLLLLEYAQPQPDADRLAVARNAIRRAPPGSPIERHAARWQALAALAQDDLPAAAAALDQNAAPAAVPLRTTLEFRRAHSAAAQRPILDRPLMARPLNTAATQWLLLSRDRRLVRYDSAADTLTILDLPSANWMPNPLTFPWLGTEPADQRGWVYDRRRLVETTAAAEAIQCNIQPESIAALDPLLTTRFTTFAALATAAQPPTDAPTGEFWAEDILAHAEFVEDPALPTLDWLAERADDDLVHLAFRGGGHLLVDQRHGQTISTASIAAQLEGDPPAWFFPVVPPGDSEQVFLATDQGLLTFDRTVGHVQRVPLPGPTPQPALIPEDLPYERSDPRYIYVATLPDAGGDVFRITVDGLQAEALDLKSIAYPPGWFAVQSRAQLRAQLDAALNVRDLPDLATLIADAQQLMTRWEARR